MLSFRVVLLTATMIAGQGAQAAAQESTAPAPPAQSEQPADAEIVVTGAPPEISSDIDRRVYSVRDDPRAQALAVVDVLATLPSVTVTPSGQVQLLGNSGVTILIDGRPPLGPNALRSLPGAQVDRIEVMTNPSARNTASGTGGIINIVTRRAQGPGITGTIIANAADDGSGLLSFSPSLEVGSWAFNGSLSFSQSETQADATRRTLVVASGEETVEHQELGSSLGELSASLGVTYTPDEHHSFSGALEASQAGDWSVRQSARVTGSGAGFEPYLERSVSDDPLRNWRISGDYQWTGDRPEERLSLSVNFDTSTWDTETTISDDFDSPAAVDALFRVAQLFDDDTGKFSLDYRRPIADSGRLETGLSWEHADMSIRQLQQTLAGAAPGLDYSRRLSGVRDTAAAYITVQFPWLGWKIKPGVRLEDQTFDVSADSVAIESGGFEFFPSLFVERRLSDELKLNFSYSRRISRPTLQQLDPGIIYTSATTGRSGNPLLGPQLTNAFEARATYNGGARYFTATLYDRETEGVFASFTQRTGDVYVSTTINAGAASSRGLELSMRAPISDHWRYVVTGNLFWRTQEILDAGLTSRRSSFSYTGNAQLDYREVGSGGADGDAPSGNEVQFALRYAGPRTLYQGETSGFVSADVVWRRPLTNRLWGVLSVSDVFDSSRSHSLIETPDFIEDTETQDLGRVVRLGLTYRLGGDD